MRLLVDQVGLEGVVKPGAHGFGMTTVQQGWQLVAQEPQRLDHVAGSEPLGDRGLEVAGRRIPAGGRQVGVALSLGTLP